MNDEPTDTPEEENGDASPGETPTEDASGFTFVEPDADAENGEPEEGETLPDESEPSASEEEEEERDGEQEENESGESEDADADNDEGDDENDDADADAEEGDGEEEGEEPDENGVSPLPITSVVEAILFAAREPLKLAQIARAVGKRTRQDAVRAAMDELNVQYLETARAFEIAEISGRFQLMSRPEYADYIMRIYPKRELTDKENKTKRLTPAMLDTLAIVAYRQPVMRSDIEHIRGVPCGPALRTLIERGSVREIGRRSDLVGKPAVFGTTERFLAEFGLGSIEELPMRSEFVAPGPAPKVEMTVVAPEEGQAAGGGEDVSREEDAPADEAPATAPEPEESDVPVDDESEEADVSEEEEEKDIAEEAEDDLSEN